MKTININKVITNIINDKSEKIGIISKRRVIQILEDADSQELTQEEIRLLKYIVKINKDRLEQGIAKTKWNNKKVE